MNKVEIAVRNMIAENFGAEGDKFEMMVEYALHHMSVEISSNSQNKPMYGLNGMLPTTLHMSLRILNGLDLDPKKVTIASDSIIDIFTFKINFQIQPMSAKPANVDYAREKHYEEFAAHCIEKINEVIAGCEEVRLHLIVSRWQEIFEHEVGGQISVSVESRFGVKKIETNE